jgi:Zn-dependent metalloprotease
MHRNRLAASAVAVAASLFASTSAQAPRPARLVPLSADSRDMGGLRQADAAVAALVRDGRLVEARRVGDTLLAGVEHQRLQQFHRGVPVWASTLAVQRWNGTPISTYGSIYDGLDAVDTTPGLTAGDARAFAARYAGVELGPSAAASLYVFTPPEGTQQGAPTLVYTVRATTASLLTYLYFIDAHTGALVDSRLDTRLQAAVGRGGGVIGDEKKVSASILGGRYVLADRLRPQQLLTLDMRGDVDAVLAVLNGTRSLSEADLGSDSDNLWTDPALVDAHVYAGWTYDYLFKRFDRLGLDGVSLPVINIVHPVRRADYAAQSARVPQFFVSAGYFGGGVQIYGDGLPEGIALNASGQTVDFLSGAIDIVAHEVAHGLTEHLEYLNESGALTEVFSDVIGTGVEFFFQRPGGARGVPDYQIGEDALSFGVIRSMSSPASIEGHPDHYSRRYLGRDDNGGVHTNCGIGNLAFYLAIEGGVHPSSGVVVTGVGASRRDQIEKIFYRAFTLMLPSRATFAIARAATIQAARDLYGAGSAAETAMTQAWTAVGVQ